MLNVPLRARGEIIGVLQFLNRGDAAPFSDEDVPRVEPLIATLAAKVAEFVRYPANFEILGVMPQQEMKAATVMFCDLTRSSVLFQEMSTSGAVQHINEYLERVCDVGFTMVPRSTNTSATACYCVSMSRAPCATIQRTP